DRRVRDRRHRDRRSRPRRARHGLSGRGRAARGGAVKPSRVGRAMSRASRVAGGAVLAALACAVVAAGGVDGAVVVGPAAPPGKPALGATIAVAYVTAMVIAAVARRLAFEPPSARAQRVSFWLRHAPDLIDVEVSLALTAAIYAALIVTGGAT